MRLRRLVAAFAALSLVAVSAVEAVAETEPGEARVTDGGTVFHRLYVQGCGKSEAERAAFADDAAEVQGGLEADGREADGSTSTSLERPTLKELFDAINALKASAKAGEEVTFTFIGHGGGGAAPYGYPDGDEELFDEQIWVNCGPGKTIDPSGQDGDQLTDDALRRVMSGFVPGVTLVLLMDTCWGGGFAGGSTDIAEGLGTAVIGPEGTCPIDGAGILGGLVTTFGEALAEGASAADADGDGIVTADELKAWLEEKGHDIGPPVDSAVPLAPKASKSKCIPAGGGTCPTPETSLSAPTALPGGFLVLDGARFPAGEAVTVSLLSPEGEELGVDEAVAGDDGAFRATVHLDVGAGPYVVRSLGTDGSIDHQLVLVAPHGGTFADDNGDLHEGAIEAIAAEGITSGCAATLFCPAGSVTRGQLAALLVRALDLPPAATGDRFRDDDGSVFEAEIEALAAAGITTGCGPESFCPGLPVTRAQVASLLARSLLFDDDVPDAFDDDAGDVHEEAINRIAAAGIASGCAPRQYCPGADVRRGQLATFLTNGLFLASFPPPPALDLDGDGRGERVVGDPTLAPGGSFTGSDGTVTVGTGPDGRVAGSTDTDGDGEEEVVVEDPSAAVGQASGGEVDPRRDRDLDIIWVGTRGGGRVAGAGDVDGGGTPGAGPDGDGEIVVTDPMLSTGETLTANPDLNPDGDRNPNDGDPDVIWVGTKEGGAVTEIGDRDGDGDDEIVFDDPTVARGTTIEVDLDGDGDPDLLRVGSGPP